jgi:hypothetical protein
MVREMVGSRTSVVHAPLLKDDPVRRSGPIGINRRSTEKSGPFSSVCRGEGWVEESAR